MNYQLDCAVWEFTLDCNLNCSHCGSSAGSPRKDELNTDECFDLCEELAEFGCEDVSLMGGEPFLREDWFQVAQCIKDLGMNLNFVSNGISLDEHIDRIARLEPKVVGISLDGMEETHDSIRGEGSFEKAIRALKLLKREEIQTTVITTLSKLNYEDLPEMKNLLLGKNINWQLQIAMPFGNFGIEKMLSKEEFYSTALFIAKERIKNKFERFPAIGAHCYGYNSKILPGCSDWEGCPAGKSAIGITSNGGIVGCLAMGNNRFIEGKVRNRSLKEIWKNPDNFQYNRNFDETKLGANCNDCKYGPECKGGCNAMSYTVTGEFHNDPYCFHRIEEEVIGL